MRGGTLYAFLCPTFFKGLSPLARGNRWMAQKVADGWGPIPACAGEPLWGKAGAA